MEPWALLALTVAGFAVGLLAGLVGIGGGVLIVPSLYFFYGHADWSGVSLSPGLHAAVSHATSLFIIVPTAVAGTWTYARSRLVRWNIVLPMAAGAAVAAVVTARLATRVPEELLQLGFGVFLVFTAIQLGRPRRANAESETRTALPLVVMTGVAVGIFSALLGVGGGLVAIPLLLYAVRLKLDQVAATSLALVAFAATAGSVSFMTSSVPEVELPAGMVGYVHVLAALPMLPGAILAARWGAKMNQRIPAEKLRRVFGVLFLLMGVRMIIVNVAALLAG